ncbi:MAG: pyridoxamine 5'-phosphate oxidase [Geodermatophilaceae bacterium]|nr:pyridoxamine 5'-phosphate oxidase [Geodermatophilaceae bacterium]MDQ3454051.1 pyridoxamine 5'-phosphate oxidase [Actinomycetota bacterium]
MGSEGPDLAAMRQAYRSAGLREEDLAPGWTAQFARWLAEAIAAQLPEPNAMVLATAATDGRPSARTVLLKGYDEAGLVFYTNYDSRKGRELTANPRASAVFPWIALSRQVVLTGDVVQVSREQSAAYFHSRPRGSQLGASASPQSQVIGDRRDLDLAWERAEAAYPDEIPLPERWGGFRLTPDAVEFWQGQTDRLHDRLRYRRTDAGWIVERLAP